MNKELIYSIEMPNYPRKIKLSDSRRAKYYIFDKVIKSKKKLPAKFGEFINNIPNEKGFCWNNFTKSNKKIEKRLWDNNIQNWVIANPKSVGTEKWEVINSQKMYNGGWHPFVQDKIVKLLHEFFGNFLKDLKPIEKFPLYIECEIHDLVIDPISSARGSKWDIYNRGLIFCKVFDDCLTEHKIIPDDNIDYVHCPSHPIFFPIRNIEKPISPDDESNSGYSYSGAYLAAREYYEKSCEVYSKSLTQVPKLVFKIYHLC